MTAKINDLHIKQVEAWERKNADGLSLEKQLKLFEKAFHAIEQRTLKTLSNVTFQVVLDRVLLQNTDKFPFLSEVKLEPQGLNFEVLIRNSASHNSGQLTEALRCLLVELLNVLGNITADILTEPLHKELHKVTSDYQQPEEKEENKILRQINSGRKKSERI